MRQNAREKEESHHLTIQIQDSLETLTFEKAADKAEQKAEAGIQIRIDAVRTRFGQGKRQKGDLRLKLEVERSDGAL